MFRNLVQIDTKVSLEGAYVGRKMSQRGKHARLTAPY